jgi:SAM-dependent methyltransferase
MSSVVSPTLRRGRGRAILAGVSAMDLSTGETLAFVLRAFREAGLDGAVRALEVGCGGGHLAARLTQAGHSVLAIDASEDAVRQARGRGVDARVARFPDFAEAGPFDAILFTRSLHHIPRIDEVMVRARTLVRAGGALVVDDFAHNRVDGTTAAWAFGMMKLVFTLISTGADPARNGDWEERDDPLAAWRTKHTDRHALHSDDVMLEAVSARFTLGPLERVPYFYRYACRYLDEHPNGVAAADAMLWAERALVGQGVIVPIGLRFVALARRTETEARS